MQDIPKDIIIKAGTGDLGAFEVIYRATSGFVYNVAYRIVHNKQDAEEVTQEVFLNVHRNLKNFRLEASFKTWVYRITANCAISRIKKLSGERNKEQEYYEYELPGRGADRSDMSAGIQDEVVDRALRILNPDQRACVVLRNIEGLSYQEISDSLGISINTVRTRLKRAREKLIVTRKEVIKNEM